MRHLQLVAIAMFIATACGGSQSAGPESASEPSQPEQGSAEAAASGDQFQLQDSDSAEQAHGERPSAIEASPTHAAMRLFVVDPDAGPLPGIVIKMTAPDGTPYYTGETDSHGYAEVLVPVGQAYQLEYLSLGRRNATARVEVPPGPNQDIRLTMRHRGWRPPVQEAEPQAPAAAEAEPEAQRIVLEGLLFDTGRATIQAESHARLDRVVEYMTHRPSARIRVAGHTDNVGNPRRNQALSAERAQAVRDYLVSHGVDGGRIEAVGYGDQHPIASNDTEEGRQQNRRIEAVEL